MPPPPQRRTRSARLLLHIFALVVLPLLLVVALTYPDTQSRAQASAEGRAAARFAARALGPLWEEALRAPRPLGLGAAHGPSVAAVEAPPLDDVAVLVELVRLEADPSPAAALASAAGAELPHRSAALLALARRARDGDTRAVELLPKTLEATAFAETVDGFPVRMVALLIASDALDRRAIEAERAALAAAADAGTVPTDDSAQWSDGALVFTPGARWTELLALAEARLSAHGGGFDPHLEERRLHDYASALRDPGAPPLTPDAWRPVHTTDGADLLARLRDGVPHVVRLDERRAARALSRTLPSGDGWWFEIRFGQPPRDPDASSGSSVVLAGYGPTGVFARGVHRRTHVLERRVDLVRALGVGVILVLLGATLVAQRALRDNERLMLLRSTFVASVSHDLRTPVASVGLLAQNLARGHAAGREAEYVTAIETETARLARLVDDMLDFNRIERGLPAKVVRERVLLRDWLEAFGATEAARCATRGKTLAVELGDLPVAADVDRLALERALSNLIDNAVAHSGAERIELRASAADGGRSLRLEVRDDGLGVRATRVERLFEPFARGDAESAGTGLGLAIVRAIAEAHGGTATLLANDPRAHSTHGAAEPTETRGLCARIDVPLDPPEGAAA